MKTIYRVKYNETEHRLDLVDPETGLVPKGWLPFGTEPRALAPREGPGIRVKEEKHE
jgi:hypothetical protein